MASVPIAPGPTVLEHFGFRARVAADVMVLPSGSNSANWLMNARGEQRWVLRCALGNSDRRALEQMATVADELHVAGVMTKVALRGDDGSSCCLDAEGLLWQCWSWIDGIRPSGSDDAAAIGAALRSFHDVVNDPRFPARQVHQPYWDARLDVDALLATIGAATAFSNETDALETVIAPAVETAGAEIAASTSTGHGDCHLDNLVKTGEGEIAVIDLELLGTRPGASLTDLGVVLHRVARAAAAAVDREAREQTAVAAALLVADAYGAGPSEVHAALVCSLHESLAKIQTCGRTPPPGLDDAGRWRVAANHWVYTIELTTLTEVMRSNAESRR